MGDNKKTIVQEPITEEYLAKLEALAQSATKGKWMLSEADAYMEVWVKGHSDNGEMPIAIVGGTVEDAQLIHVSHEAIPLLCQEIRRLRTELSE